MTVENIILPIYMIYNINENNINSLKQCKLKTTHVKNKKTTKFTIKNNNNNLKF